MPKRRFSPAIEGNLEISRNPDGILIGGDPDGLRSLGRLLIWLADVDQESHPTMLDGQRARVHLHANEPVNSSNSLTSFSEKTELSRLDAKGTGNFPEKYPDKPDGRKRLGH
jgi:hypothetical protein